MGYQSDSLGNDRIGSADPAIRPSGGNGDSRSSEDIERNIRSTRSRMDTTIDQLEARLNPRAFLHQISGWFGGGGSSSSSSESAAALKRTGQVAARHIRENPIPAALIGAGVIWMIADAATEDEDEIEGAFDDDSLTESERVALARGSYALPEDAAGGWGDDGDPSMKDQLKAKAEHAGASISGAARSAKAKVAGAGHSLGAKARRAKGRARAAGSRNYRRAQGAGARLGHRIEDGYRHGEERFRETMDDHPLGLALGFLGLGLLAGVALPRSRAEDEWFGERSDAFEDAAAEKSRDLARRGKSIASRAGHAALDESEAQGMTAENAKSALKSVGDKLKSVAAHAREEAEAAARDENVHPDQVRERAEEKSAESNKPAEAPSSSGRAL